MKKIIALLTSLSLIIIPVTVCFYNVIKDYKKNDPKILENEKIDIETQINNINSKMENVLEKIKSKVKENTNIKEYRLSNWKEMFNEVIKLTYINLDQTNYQLWVTYLEDRTGFRIAEKDEMKNKSNLIITNDYYQMKGWP